MDEYIMEISGAATPEFCAALIEKYEQDSRALPGLIGPERATDTEIRDSMNIEMHLYPDWKKEVDELRAMVYSRLPEYIDDIHVGKTKSMWKDGYDMTYTMMKYVPGGHYSWHNDFNFDDQTGLGGCRTVTWLFYLNDVEEGGETEFKWGRKIKPETGKLVLFPSCMTMVHRGNPVVSGSKYLVVGWLYSQFNRVR